MSPVLENGLKPHLAINRGETDLNTCPVSQSNKTVSQSNKTVSLTNIQLETLALLFCLYLLIQKSAQGCYQWI